VEGPTSEREGSSEGESFRRKWLQEESGMRGKKLPQEDISKVGVSGKKRWWFRGTRGCPEKRKRANCRREKVLKTSPRSEERGLLLRD